MAARGASRGRGRVESGDTAATGLSDEYHEEEDAKTEENEDAGDAV